MRKNLVVIGSLFFSSCMATQKDMLILQSQIDDLNTNIYTLKKNQADLSLKIEDLNRNLTAFSENSKDLNIEINKLSSKIEDMGTVTDKKINQLGKAVNQKSEKEEEYYRETSFFYKALSFYSSQRYEPAIESFKEYILKFPKGDNIDQAYFYAAESLFEIKNYKEAAIFYAKLISGYPNFAKTAYVRLKYSKALLELNDKNKIDEAITYLKSVEKEFPNTVEAVTAKEILSELKTQKPAGQLKNKRN